MTAQEQEEYNLLQQDIGVVLIRSLPPDWDAAKLELRVTENGLGSGVAHQITNPNGKNDVVFPTDELLLTTRRFELSSVKHSLHWQSASFDVTRRGENWHVDSHIDYGD